MLHFRMKSHSRGEERACEGRSAAFRRRWRRAFRLLPLALLVVTIASCAPGDAPPPGVCDTYSRSLFTTQLLGGAAVLLGLAVLGFRKNVSAILPSQGIQVGAVAGALALGLSLLAFSTDVGNQILTGFGLDSLYSLCGLG
jgi:hypothetical protein